MGSKGITKWPKEITSSFVEQRIRAEKDLKKAILIFDSTTGEYKNGYRHDHKTFGTMVSRLVSVNQFKAAEDLLNRMKDEKCIIGEEIFLSICRGYGRIHKPHETIRIFQKMQEFECKPSEKSYISVLAILAAENQVKMAFRFYKYMRAMGFPPTVTSLNVLIKALCKNPNTMDAAMRIFREMPNRGFIPDSYSYGTLISGFCRSGKIHEARELFVEMEAKGCSRTVITYTNMIHCFCQSNNLAEAMRLLGEMKRKGIEPNVFTYSSLMDGLCKSGHCSKAMELLEIMTSKHLNPNMVTYSTLIHGLCKEKKTREAMELLDRMKLQGLRPDAKLYLKIVNGLCDAQKFQEAANFLDEMLLEGIPPNRLTWGLHVQIHNIVLQGLLTESDQIRPFRLYLSMRTRGISVEAKTYESLVKYFCEKGDLHKATRVAHEMVVDGCIPGQETWMVLVSGFWDGRKVQEAGEITQVELISELVEAGVLSGS